jgi:hypothetical protein
MSGIDVFSPMPRMRDSVIDGLLNTSGYHSDRTELRPRDAGNARGKSPTGRKVNRGGQRNQIRNAQGPPPNDVDSHTVQADCPSCRNAVQPGLPAEAVRHTLSNRNVRADLRGRP